MFHAYRPLNEIVYSLQLLEIGNGFGTVGQRIDAIKKIVIDDKWEWHLQYWGCDQYAHCSREYILYDQCEDTRWVVPACGTQRLPGQQW